MIADPADASSSPPTAPAGARPPYAILYVDDEEQALKYFKKTFAKAFDVLTATSVDEAIATLNARHATIGIVLTDHRMPGRTGVELLAHVKASWPGIMRIMVTAYADVESAVGAVNSGAVYKYLTKPMDLALTKRVLVEAMGSFVEVKDREAAVADQGELFERAIVADRVRNAARMASGVSHHVRNSLTAVNCFFEEMRDRVATARTGFKESGTAAQVNGDGEYLDQLLVLADQERSRLLGMISDVEARGARRSFRFDEKLDLAEVVSRAVVATKQAVRTPGRPLSIAVDIPAGAATLAVDVPAIVQMLSALFVHADRYSAPGSTVRVVTDGVIQLWGTEAIRLRILGSGPAWPESDVAALFTPFSLTTKAPNDVGLDLLDAFQTALGHEGDIIVHAAAPQGPGFEVRLPLNPAAVRRPVLSGVSRMPAPVSTI